MVLAVSTYAFSAMEVLDGFVMVKGFDALDCLKVLVGFKVYEQLLPKRRTNRNEGDKALVTASNETNRKVRGERLVTER